jgi:ligand-binding sensor domain-containing protein/class 3 adenylate cyclase
LFIAICSCKTKQENKSADTSATDQQYIFETPLITFISSLPDSLLPKTTFLDSMPQPLTIQVPISSGGAYRGANEKGERSKIMLKPPITKPLSFLYKDNSVASKDHKSRSFFKSIEGKPHFTNFNSDKGLPLDGILCSIMDKKGNLWFGTDGGGACRYDGISFTTYSTNNGLAGSSVWCIAEDNSGNLWFGNNGRGVSRYDGNSFTTFSTADGLAGNIVLSILEDKAGNLWFGTNGGGVSRCNPSSLQGNNTLTFTTFSTVQGLAGNTVLSIAEDKAGNLWFGTDGGGVSRYDPLALLKSGLPHFTTFTTRNGLSSNVVRSIMEDKAGNIWLGTQNGEVSCYDPSVSFQAGSQFFTTFSVAEGLESNIVTSIVEDKVGNLWFSTMGGGVNRYDGSSFTTFSTDQGLENSAIFCIAEDKAGNLWFGTRGGGVSRYNGNSITTFSIAQGLINNIVLSIAKDKSDNLWLGTWGGGVIRYDGKSFTTYSTAQGLANDLVSCIFEDKYGKLWFGTWGGGVSCFDGKSFTTYTTSQGLANDLVSKIVGDKSGNLWIGTWGGGVSRYDGKSFTTFSKAQGLVNNTIVSILKDKAGNLWFGTDGGGLSRLAEKHVENLTEETLKAGMANMNLFESFTSVEGLADEVVYDMVEDSQGNIFIGTNLGFTMIPAKVASSSFNQISPALEYYNSSYGFPVKDVNTKAMYCDSKGIIWAGTGNSKTALVRFDYSKLNKNDLPPVLVIKSIKVDEQNICWHNLASPDKFRNTPTRKLSVAGGDSLTSLALINEEVSKFGRSLKETERSHMKKKFGNIKFDSITKYYQIPEKLVLPYKHHQITIDFNAIEVSKPNLINYQYMLEGYDKEWSPVLKKTSITFGNIYEGTYTFKVKAQGPNGVWCEPLYYTFQVSPPMHRTWWAYFFYLISGITLIVLVFRWRTAALRRDKEKLEHTVTERTAELVLEKKKSDDLLLNILPSEVAEELKTKGYADAKHFDEVSVMFTDFKGFTLISERITPAELVAELDYCFKAFDQIITKYNIEKIKTIGDSYMCVAGLPVPNSTHAIDAVSAAMEIQQFMQEHSNRRQNEGKETFESRIGIHTGPVIAGIVGVKKFAYDIWGDTVNIASRMESSGEVGMVNISGSTFEKVKENFICHYRGIIQAKNKGEIDMYFVKHSQI